MRAHVRARRRRCSQAGCELEAMTAGRLRAQLAMYRLGGMAILDAIRRASFRTDAVRPEVSAPVKARLAAEAIALLASRPRPAPRAAAASSQAERVCQRLARVNAANFYWGFIALPRPQRTAIYALYDFARQVDDAVDFAAAGDPRAALGATRARACAAPSPASPTTRSPPSWPARWRRTASRRRSWRHSSTVSSATSPRRATRTWDELAGYCRLVASTVGRMCVRIFGFDDEVALRHADDLGLAMQLTNILRDVRGDLELGRVYLPADELAAFGISEQDLAGGRRRPRAGTSSSTSRRAAPGVCSRPGCAWSATSRREPGSACAPWPASTSGSSREIERAPRGSRCSDDSR